MSTLLKNVSLLFILLALVSCSSNRSVNWRSTNHTDDLYISSEDVWTQTPVRGENINTNDNSYSIGYWRGYRDASPMDNYLWMYNPYYTNFWSWNYRYIFFTYPYSWNYHWGFWNPYYAWGWNSPWMGYYDNPYIWGCDWRYRNFNSSQRNIGGMSLTTPQRISTPRPGGLITRQPSPIRRTPVSSSMGSSVNRENISQKNKSQRTLSSSSTIRESQKSSLHRDPQDKTRELSSNYTPRTYTPSTPSTPRSYTPSAPSTPRSYTPSTPRSYTPSAPSTPRSYTPSTPRTYTPSTPRTYTPSTPRTYTPSAPSTPRSYTPSRTYTPSAPSAPRSYTPSRTYTPSTPSRTYTPSVPRK